MENSRQNIEEIPVNSASPGLQVLEHKGVAREESDLYVRYICDGYLPNYMQLKELAAELVKAQCKELPGFLGKPNKPASSGGEAIQNEEEEEIANRAKELEAKLCLSPKALYEVSFVSFVRPCRCGTGSDSFCRI